MGCSLKKITNLILSTSCIVRGNKYGVIIIFTIIMLSESYIFTMRYMRSILMEFKSGYAGQGEVGYRILKEQGRMRIMSDSEVQATKVVFSRYSNLSPDQYAINNWGFPFIPKPFPRTEYGYLRIAPEEVSKGFFGHPIYWIDPKLTRKRDNERWQEWSIRMFVLIDAMGYWNENLEFIDFLKIQGFDFSNANIAVYFDNADQRSITDDYKLLDEESIIKHGSSLQQVEERYVDILQQCFAIQDYESVKMLERQAEQYNFAKNTALGPDVKKYSTAYDYPGGVWDSKILPALLKINNEYDQRALEDNYITSDLLKMTHSIENVLLETVRRYHKAANTLELPLHLRINKYGGESSSYRISAAASMMEIANKKEVVREVQFKEISETILTVLGSGNIGHGAFNNVIQAMSKVYSRAWDRLRLVFVNYDRLREGKPLYATTSEMLASFREQESAEGGLKRDQHGFVNTTGNLTDALQSFRQNDNM